MSADPVVEQLARHRVVPVIALRDPNSAEALAQALAAGGLPVAEVTFRTAGASRSIRAMAGISGMLVGAGTVLTVEQACEAVDSGAQFIVAPGLNPKVVQHCINSGIPIFPGVATPSEIEQALDLGLSTLKFFPAEAIGGVKLLKALAAPYGMVRFMPTGGITSANLGDYLKLPMVTACGGSWMVAPELINECAWDRVRSLTAEAVTLVQALG
jgi:2-dehydro-3-deoxyphosphogluconate aldolase/(4S)-4-hydroxy-2-oxoglutarate aldolase